jgi:glycosyltransferase involved in cell wall biosynthesis
MSNLPQMPQTPATVRKIVHLVDDTTAGGVMRAVDYMTTHPELAADASHEIVQIRKGAWRIGRFEADIIVSHTTLSWRGLPGLISLRAMNPGARLLHVEHSYTRNFTALNVPDTGRFFAMLRLSYALFDGVVAVSRTQADWLRERALVSAEALQVISPLVDLAPFAAVRHVHGMPKTIGAIGRLDRQKGFDILIEGFRRWADPEARLLIFGEGDQRADLERLAGDDARIRFLGHAGDPAMAMAQVGVVAMPSRWEAYGLVCLEAQAAGRPVMAARADGLADAGRGDVFHVADNTPDGWAAAFAARFAPTRTAALASGAPVGAEGARWQDAWSRTLAG